MQHVWSHKKSLPPTIRSLSNWTNDEIFRINNLIKERIFELVKYLRIFGCHLYSMCRIDVFNNLTTLIPADQLAKSTLQIKISQRKFVRKSPSGLLNQFLKHHQYYTLVQPWKDRDHLQFFGCIVMGCEPHYPENMGCAKFMRRSNRKGVKVHTFLLLSQQLLCL